MPRIMKDIAGQRFGMLVALSPAYSTNKKWHWNYKCDCGTECVKEGAEVTKSLRVGRVPNCGCARGRLISEATRTHGLSQHPGYWVWRSMKARCSNPRSQAYKNYGGRGIKVCPEWESSFEAFWADMGPTYQSGLELDRTDNEQGYSPENCRWVPRKQNIRNKRNNRFIETPWGSITVAEAAERSGLGVTTILYRLEHGWDSTRATTTPPGPFGRKHPCPVRSFA